jgi:hypothetical protein
MLVEFLRENGLTIVLALATIATLTDMILTGAAVYNDLSFWRPNLAWPPSFRSLPTQLLCDELGHITLRSRVPLVCRD